MALDFYTTASKLFNVDTIFRSLAVGTKTGYKLFSLGSVDKLEQIYENGKPHIKV